MKLGWFKWPAVVIVGIMVLAIVVSFFRDAEEEERVGLGTVMDLARSGEAGRLEVHAGSSVTAVLRNGEEVEATIGDNTDVAMLLAADGVEIGSGLDVVYDEPNTNGLWYSIGFNLAYLMIFAVVMYFAIGRAVRNALRTASRDATIRDSEGAT